MTVALAGTWVPRGELSRFQRYLPHLREIYDAIVIVLPPDVDAESLEAVQAMEGVQYGVMERLGQGRYMTLQMAVEQTDADYIQYADMDRLIRWVELYPDELKQTVERMKTTDYLLMGRTEYAWNTHPRALADTERVIHDVFEHLLGIEDCDLCAGAKGFSRRAAEFIVANGTKDYGLGTDTEWTVLAHRGGFAIDQVLVDGLDWETADRFRDTAADPETQQQQAAEYDEQTRTWVMRVDICHKIITAGLDALKLEPLKGLPVSDSETHNC